MARTKDPNYTFHAERSPVVGDGEWIRTINGERHVTGMWINPPTKPRHRRR